MGTSHGAPGQGRTPPPLSPRAWTKQPGEAPRIWDKKENVSRLLNVLYALCAVLVVLDFVVPRHSEHPWEHVVAFYPLYGFVGIVILVLAAKGLRRLVMRAEDYYDAE
jgi:peptidoglycan/LPS O-acetylase OafA/YrhL